MRADQHDQGQEPVEWRVSTSAANALIDAKEQAAGLGANVVVIQRVDGGSMYTPATATVKAYRCN